MLAIKDALQVLQSYNIYSQKYEPTIYENNKNVGICLDIKDSLFGYLTRVFTFKEKKELDNFLTSFFWYKNNYQKYHIKLTLDNYNTKNPHIIYQYKNQTLTLDDMLNINTLFEEEQKKNQDELEKKYFLSCIQELTNYLINFRQMKENIKLEKNQLKTEENDLKYTLLTQLTIYYGKEKKLAKKPITLDPPSNLDHTLLLNNLNSITQKDLAEMKQYLNSLINIIKSEELDEKNLVNIYSNNVYHYNIDILNKQIEFVKNKINAEKNFNVKGSRLHNIDEELRSFLKTNTAPTKIEVFLNDNKTRIEEKFNSITDIKNACQIITGKQPPEELETTENDLLIDSQAILLNAFKNLPKSTQNNLILYHSLYKPICNYIIDHHYPDVNTIISQFDFDHYYRELEEIVFDENNNHYLTNYFSTINFKDINSYINSIINICKDLENTQFSLSNPLQLFATHQTNKYKQLTNIPSLNSKYLVNVREKITFIPYKLIIDWDNLEINVIEEESYYTPYSIIEEIDSIILAKYQKQNIQKNDIIITTDLILEETLTFNKSHLEGENYE